jgi:hypothetical protein
MSDDKEYVDIVPGDYSARGGRAPGSVTSLAATRFAGMPPGLTSLAKPGKALARGRASAAPKLRTKGKRGKPRDAKGWLSGTTLQDVADFSGAVWRYGRAALALIGNIEEKFFDVSASSQSVVPTSSATVVNLSNIVQGTDWNQRLGNSIRAQNLRIDYSLFCGASTTYAFARCIVFRDLMQSGTDPTAANLLENTAGAVSVNAPYLHYTADRFEVLSDETFAFAAAGGPAAFHRRFGCRINDHILYSSTAGADASNWQGALYLLVIGDQATAGNQPQIHYWSRLSFTDD